jgi:transcriptional regulator with XRE-family HTH domain
MTGLGTRLKAARIAAGFSSQQALADAAGVSRSTIKRLELDQRTLESECAVKVSRALGGLISAHELAGLPPSRTVGLDEAIEARGALDRFIRTVSSVDDPQAA